MNFKIEKETITADVSFANSVWVSINLPLTVSINELTYEINDFNIEIPIDMENIYTIASDLAFYHDLYAYPEQFTLDLIEKYSWRGGAKTKPTYLPPKRFTSAGFDCSQETWTIDEVKNDLKDNYNQNLKYLKIANTKFQKETSDNPAVQSVFDSYIQNFFTQPYPTIRAEYMYDEDWFFNLDILPKSGNLLRADRTTAMGIPLMPRLCTFKYRFNYFYDFPILLKVTDDNSAKINVNSNTFEKGAGYEFHVPLWVNVCGNQKRECTGRAATYDLIELNETAFCEDSQKLSGDITINIDDGTNKIEDVDVYYKGVDALQNCFIGRTDNNGKMTGKFPFCTGCQIELYKKDYPVKKQRMDVLDYNNKELNVSMPSFTNLNVNVKLIKIPKFVRSWHETDGFTNIGKMIKLAPEYNYPNNNIIAKGESLNLNMSDLDDIKTYPQTAESLNSLLTQLKNSNEFKAIIPVLKGETNLNSAYEDNAMITSTGSNQFYYFYPDVENTKLKLSPGIYNINLAVTGKVDIRNTSLPSAPAVKDTFPLSPDMTYIWHIDDLTGKSTVTFYSLAEYSSIELNPGEWSMLLDSIMDNGTMKAELLYVASPVYDSDGDVVNCVNYRFNKINGRVESDLNAGVCRNIVNVDIKKEEYLPYILPQLN